MGNYMLDNMELAGCSVVLGENIQRLEDDPQYWGHDRSQLARL